MELLSLIFTFHFALICNSVILPVDANQEQSELSFEELSNFAASVSYHSIKFIFIINYLHTSNYYKISYILE